MPAWLHQDWCLSFVLALGHFLWQGTLIALVLAIVLRAVKSVAARYWLSLTALLLMAACPVMTLFWLMQPVSPVAVLDTPPPIVSEEFSPSQPMIPPTSFADADKVEHFSKVPVIPPVAPIELNTTSTTPPQALADDRRWWQRFAPQLTTAYLGGVALMFLRLVIGLWGGRRLRRRAVPVTDDSLLGAMQRQATALGLKLLPVLAYCERVTVPTVVGVLKPMILLPVTLATGLSPEQIESVLAHELAHLRRYDHLVNLLQRVIESLLFFHPALWWVSHRIRDEREHCCDDLVVACGAMPLDYAKSLLVVAELSRASQLRRSVAAVSLLATGNQKPSNLRQRIARLLGESATPSLRISPRALLLAIGIPVLAVIATIQSGSSHPIESPASNRDGSQTMLVIEWFAVVDDGLVQEIRALKPTAGEELPATGAETIRRTSDEVRAIVKKRRGDPAQVLLSRNSSILPPSAPGFRPTGIAHTSGFAQHIKIGDHPVSVMHGGGGFYFVEERNNAAGVRLKMHYSFGVGSTESGNVPVNLDADIAPGEAIVNVIGLKPGAEWQASMIMVHEAIRVPANQVEFFKPLARADDWIRFGSAGTKQRLARAAAWQSKAKRDASTVEPAWTRNAPNGGHVQLVAISRPKQGPMIWWDPEGRSISGIDHNPFTSTSHADEDIVALVRIWEDGVRRNLHDPGGSRSGNGTRDLPERADVTAGSQLVTIPAVLVNADGRQSLKIGAGFGVWTAETKLKADRDATAKLGDLTVRTAAVFDHSVVGKTTTLFRWTRTRDFDLTTAAVTKNGKVVASTSNPTVYDNPTVSTNEPSNTLNSGIFFDHPLLLAEIDHFLIKSRPCNWTEFTGFAIEPTEPLDPPLNFQKPDDEEHALDPTAGLPNSDEATKPPNNANGDLRSKPAAGSGDPRRAQPDGLEFLKPYPKLHGLSLDMTELQFLGIVKQQELKASKTVDGEKVTHHIALGDGHKLIVMFDKDATCSGIKRVRGELPPNAERGRLSFQELRELVKQLNGAVTTLDKNEEPSVRVELKSENVDDSAIRKLVGYRNLRWVWTNGKVPITDEALAALAQCDSLKELHLQAISPAITDAGLKHLARLPNLESLRLSNITMTDAGMKHLASFPRLKELNVSSNQLGDEGIASLAPMEGLENLMYDTSNLTDDGLKAISKSKSLKYLQIHSKKVSDVGMTHLAQMTDITGLVIQDSEITDAGVMQLASLPQLIQLFVMSDQLGDEGIASLAPMEGLMHLMYEGAKLSDDGLKAISKSKSLQIFDFSSEKVTDIGLTHLAQMTDLESLGIENAEITDAGILVLKQPNLQSVSLDHCPKITADGVKAWKAAAPHIKIEFHDEAVAKLPAGFEFLKPYPKLQGLSLDMTEPQFLEIVKQQELKTRKTIEDEKVTHHIVFGDGHTLIVMFDKDAKCSGIQRVRGEDDEAAAREDRLGDEKKPDNAVWKTIDSGPVAECRAIIKRLDEAGEVKLASGARERLAKRWKWIAEQPVASFLRELPKKVPNGEPNFDRGPLVGVQTELDGVWSNGKGTADNWKDWIVRKQKDYRIYRLQLLFEAAQGYRKVADAASAKRVLQAGLSGHEIYDAELKTLISKHWPVTNEEPAKSLGSGPEAWTLVNFLGELSSAQQTLGEIDQAIITHSRLLLAHFLLSWGQPSDGPNKHSRELWSLIRQRPEPLPPLFWFNVINEKNPQHKFDLSSAGQKGKPLTYHYYNLTAAPSLDFAELTITARTRGRKGILD